MTISFVREQASVNLNNNTSEPMTYQSGGAAPVNGNLALVALANSKGSQVTYTDPAGSRYTVRQGPNASGATASSVQLQLESRLLSSDGGVLDTWVGSPASPKLATILEYAGVDSSTPVDVTILASNSGTTLAGITTVTDGCMLLYISATRGATITGDQAGWTQRVLRTTSSGTNDPTLYVAEKLQTTHGATGSVGALYSVNPAAIEHYLVALRASGATPHTVPDPPTALAVKPGNRRYLLSWTAPVNTGGDPITGYTITVDGSVIGSVGGGVTTVTIAGQKNNTVHVTTVHATNVNGNSVESGSVSIVPFAVPARIGMRQAPMGGGVR